MLPLITDLLSGATPDFATFLAALGERMPLLEALGGTEQDPVWHAEGDVATHTGMVLEETYGLLAPGGAGAHLEGWSRVALVLAAALHDIAKPLTTMRGPRDGVERVIAPRHAERGRDYIAPRLLGIGLPHAVVHDVMALVGHHHDPKRLVLHEQRGGAKPWLGYHRLWRLADLERLYLLELADMRGRRCPDQAEQVELMELFALMAAEHGALGAGSDPYAALRGEIAHALRDHEPRFVRWVQAEAVRDYEAGLIATPHEALARSYAARERPLGELVVTVGPSGSGKSAYVDALVRDEGFEVVSLDALRETLTGAVEDQRRNGEVVAAARERLRELMRARKRVVWDATSLRRDLRKPIIGLGMDYGALVRLVVFLVPQDELHARNQARARRVPSDVLARQIERMELPTADEAHEVEWQL